MVNTGTGKQFAHACSRKSLELDSVEAVTADIEVLGHEDKPTKALQRMAGPWKVQQNA